jgi:uncharacterized membrane protein YczE
MRIQDGYDFISRDRLRCRICNNDDETYVRTARNLISFIVVVTSCILAVPRNVRTY